jgi:hypothetical protein
VLAVASKVRGEADRAALAAALGPHLELAAVVAYAPALVDADLAGTAPASRAAPAQIRALAARLLDPSRPS